MSLSYFPLISNHFQIHFNCNFLGMEEKHNYYLPIRLKFACALLQTLSWAQFWTQFWWPNFIRYFWCPIKQFNIMQGSSKCWGRKQKECIRKRGKARIVFANGLQKKISEHNHNGVDDWTHNWENSLQKDHCTSYIKGLRQKYVLLWFLDKWRVTVKWHGRFLS